MKNNIFNLSRKFDRKYVKQAQDIDTFYDHTDDHTNNHPSDHDSSDIPDYEPVYDSFYDSYLQTQNEENEREREREEQRLRDQYEEDQKKRQEDDERMLNDISPNQLFHEASYKQNRILTLAEHFYSKSLNITTQDKLISKYGQESDGEESDFDHYCDEVII